MSDKKFEAVIYFNGPASKWARYPQEHEAIFRKQFRTKFFADVWMTATMRRFKDWNLLSRVREL